MPTDTDDAVAALATMFSHPPQLQQWHQSRVCTRLWLRLAVWYIVHVAYFMRRPSASATLVLNLVSLICSLSAGAVVQLMSVTSVWPGLLLMQAAVSADAHSLNQMTTCVNADDRFHWNPPPPLSALSAEVFILAHYYGPPSTETPTTETTIVRCLKNSWIYFTSTYYWWLETNDNYSIRFEISNNSLTIRFDSKWKKNTIRSTALRCWLFCARAMGLKIYNQNTTYKK